MCEGKYNIMQSMLRTGTLQTLNIIALTQIKCYLCYLSQSGDEIVFPKNTRKFSRLEPLERVREIRVHNGFLS